jgi:hypothetical protein
MPGVAHGLLLGALGDDVPCTPTQSRALFIIVEI